jgi:hypothetical protein
MRHGRNSQPIGTRHYRQDRDAGDRPSAATGCFGPHRKHGVGKPRRRSSRGFQDGAFNTMPDRIRCHIRTVRLRRTEHPEIALDNRDCKGLGARSDSGTFPSSNFNLLRHRTLADGITDVYSRPHRLLGELVDACPGRRVPATVYACSVCLQGTQCVAAGNMARRSSGMRCPQPSQVP